MVLSSVVDHSSSPELFPLMVHSKMMVLSLDMILFLTVEPSKVMDHSKVVELSLVMIHFALLELSMRMDHSSCV
jgi:hypothetical protein